MSQPIQVRGEHWDVADGDGKSVAHVRDVTITIESLPQALRLWGRLTLAIVVGILASVFAEQRAKE